MQRELNPNFLSTMPSYDVVGKSSANVSIIFRARFVLWLFWRF